MAERKLNDEDLARLRRLSETGWAVGDLAEAFDLSQGYVSRLLRGDRRAVLPSVEDVVGAPDGVLAAVDGFLGEVGDFRRDDAVLAAMARVLGGKLDAAAASDAAAAAQAVPRLSQELAAVLEALGNRAPRERDALDELREQREQRLARNRAARSPETA